MMMMTQGCRISFGGATERMVLRGLLPRRFYLLMVRSPIFTVGFGEAGKGRGRDRG